MRIFNRERPRKYIDIPLTTDCFHRNKRSRENLIIDSPAIVEAFTQLNGPGWYGKVSLDMDLWSDSSPVLSAKLYNIIADMENLDGYYFSYCALTDEEIDLVVKACYPILKYPKKADSYHEAMDIEKWKRDQLLTPPNWASPAEN